MADSLPSSHDCPSMALSPHSSKTDDTRQPCECGSRETWVDSVSSGFPRRGMTPVRKVDYMKYKEILQKPSTVTGDSLYNHLVDVITRIIDERPENVIDYFEEYSRDVRQHRFRFTEQAAFEPYVEPQFLELAKSVLRALKLPYAMEELECIEEEVELYGESVMTEYQTSETSFMPSNLLMSHHNNILQYQHFWSFCGLGFQIDEAFQLSWAIQKIQTHHAVQSARFWGRIYGTHGSYYIVEAVLTKSEIHQRFIQMEKKLMSRMIGYIHRRDNPKIPEEDRSLIPGANWQNYPIQTLKRMQPVALPAPILLIDETFEMPAEPIGSGLNRKAYFVTTSLSKEWTELPVVTPKQIQISRKIKKHFTGHLDARLHCYPLFPGTEKNYLRAMIARITAGSYIAPYGFYRKMNKRERIAAGEIEPDDIEEEEEEALEEEEEEDLDNDTPITVDVCYTPMSLEDLGSPCSWVHYRPHILKQGRVHYLDEELAFRELERDALMRIKKKQKKHDFQEEEEEEHTQYGEEEGEEEEDLLDEDVRPPPEVGPELFSIAGEDTNAENVKAWSSRLSGIFNKTNQMIIMRSNLWPGAYSFAFGKYCDSIYLGWGLKYVGRSTHIQHIPPTQDLDYPDLSFEATDPTVEMEEKWRLYHMKRELMAMEEMSISVDFDADDVEDDDRN